MERRYKQGVDRLQESFLPSRVEDYVGADNQVRAIDAYVRSLDLKNLGFTNSDNYTGTGQPSYSPVILLSLYLWGYLNRIRSSRRLELECKRNLELIWLVENLTPGYHTIADFRKNNPKALRKANREFVVLCKSLDLFGSELVAIDSVYLEGDASRASIYTKKKLKKLLEEIDNDIYRYNKEIDQADLIGSVSRSSDKLKDKISKLNDHRQSLHKLQEQLKESNEKQISYTDEDARMLSKPTDKGPTVGYALQAVIDSKNKLIAVADITVDSSDQDALIPVLQATKEILGVENLIALADAGYYKNSNVSKSEEENIELYMPLPDKGKAKRNAGQFERSDFTYNKDEDFYTCPNGEKLPLKGQRDKEGTIYKKYYCSRLSCRKCLMRKSCISEKAANREVYRSEFEEAVERHRVRMKDAGGEMMRRRSGLAEHPFGTLKLWLGWTHFLVRGIEKVKGEMALLTTAYNFKRVLNIIGIEKFIAACTS